MKKHFFVYSFMISALVHIPLYSFAGSYFFMSAPQPAHIKAEADPIFSYRPVERNVVIKSAPYKKNISTEKKTTVRPATSDKVQVKKQQRVNEEKPVIRKEDGSEIKDLIKKHADMLLPTVENVDLDNAEIREVFFNYYDLLSSIIGRFAVYPFNAREKHVEGVAYVSFLLRKNGQLGDIILRHSSGQSLLDRAAMSAVQNAAPFPPLPRELHKDEIRLNVPISFEIE